MVGESVDDVLGIVYLKDLARKAIEPKDTTVAEVPVAQVMRDAAFVPESKPVTICCGRCKRLVAHRRGRGRVRRYRRLITIEDILEEIVGEITDEYDVAERLRWSACPTGSARVTARLPVEDLSELYHVDLPTDEVETVGGCWTGSWPGADLRRDVVIHGLLLTAEGTTVAVTGSTRVVRPPQLIPARKRPRRTSKPVTPDGAVPSSSGHSQERDELSSWFRLLFGRPNAGKSTLTNALVGQKIAITRTVRRPLGNRARRAAPREFQLVLVDTPGCIDQEPLLGERLNDLVARPERGRRHRLCLPADEEIGKGTVSSPRRSRAEGHCDRPGDKGRPRRESPVTERLLAVAELGDFAEIVPVSAVTGEQLDTLVDGRIRPPAGFTAAVPGRHVHRRAEQVLIAELIREAALEGYATSCHTPSRLLVEEIIVEGDLTKIYADVYVERPSQKAIVIGARGSRLKEVGSRPARRSRICWVRRSSWFACSGRQGLAARSQAASQAWLLERTSMGNSFHGRLYRDDPWCCGAETRRIRPDRDLF